MTKTKINISRLKDFALAKLPKDWVVRGLILSEENEMDVDVFLVRLPVYLKLLGRVER